MKRLQYFILLTISLHLFSCIAKKERIDYALQWTKDIKAKIIEDANRKPDSTNIKVIDSTLEIITTYKDKALLKRIRVNPVNKEVLGTVFYGKDQDFALARELCPLLSDEDVEVIFYKQMTLGLHEFHYCNGKVKKSGLNIHGFVGEWKEYDEKGNVVKTTDYGNLGKLDTLKAIKFYR